MRDDTTITCEYNGFGDGCLAHNCQAAFPCLKPWCPHCRLSQRHHGVRQMVLLPLEEGELQYLTNLLREKAADSKGGGGYRNCSRDPIPIDLDERLYRLNAGLPTYKGS